MKIPFRLLFILLAGLALSSGLQAQTRITGSVGDSLGRPVSSATVSLVRLSDSTLYSFFLTGDDGAFKFERVPAGRYRVHATHLNFHPKAVTVEVTSGQPTLAVEPFRLQDHSIVIEGAVIVADVPPVMMKGDTLEFNAGSFRTMPNAVVEDLLKKIPGLEVGADGSLTVNGQRVNKVLVDGKEFFGDDPRIATKNLPADAVDKVQVFDQKNDAEQVTGMDDGELDMTLNLKLKNGHKKGLFGQVMAAAGTSQRWQGKANIHAFTKSNQFSLLSNANNISEPSFSFMELMQLTGASEDMRGGNFRFNMDDNDMGFPIQQLMRAQDKGLNEQASAGLRWAHDWGDTLTLMASYFGNWFRPDVLDTTARTYFLPDSVYYNNILSREQMNMLNHRLMAYAIWKPRSKTTLRFKPALSLYGNTSNVSTVTTNANEEQNSGSTATSLSEQETDNWLLTSELKFTHGFQRKGRSLSASLNDRVQQGDGSKTLDNQLLFSSPDTTFATPGLEQRWFSASSQQVHTARIAYTEPFLHRWLVELSLNGNYTRSDNAREAFSLNTVTGEYNQLVTQLSNDFNSLFTAGSGGVAFRRAGRKLNFALGADYQVSRLQGSISSIGFEVDRNFHSLLPNARLEYNFSQSKSLEFNYRSRLQSPGVTQLQPLPDPSNPLYQQTGNPDLNPQITHSINGEFRKFSMQKSNWFMIMADVQLMQDAIGTSTSIDSIGVTRTMPVNVDGNWSANSMLVWSFPIKKIKSRFNIQPRGALSRTANLVNGEANPSLFMSFSPELRWTFSPTDSFEIGLTGRYQWNESSFLTGSTGASTRITGTADLLWMLPLGFVLKTDFSVNRVESNEQVTTFPLWSGSLSKFWFKGNRLESRFTVFDILNQNTGITRTTQNAYAQVQSYNLLHRYFMFGLTWRLQNHKPGGGGRGNHEIRITQ